MSEMDRLQADPRTHRPGDRRLTDVRSLGRRKGRAAIGQGSDGSTPFSYPRLGLQRSCTQPNRGLRGTWPDDSESDP
jgi:hypothetical protein